VWRKVRAYNPWPVAYSYIGGEPLRILECVAIQDTFREEPGTVFAFSGVGEPPLFGAGFGVVAREGEVAVITVQAPGGRAMNAGAYLNGHGAIIGKKLRAAPE
jgi:methionyl-tRNA formyltransferase